ncbi:pirin family protein [Vibrio scophthalmi]|uniref:pirin family protein n=1 Tax=Vibrio scophthalmi TaxID=45658 RepID=UPI003AAD4897
MIEIRHADERGHANIGWLDSKHSFSFGQYYDPLQMGFSALRVINDDVIAPGAGFDTHPHKDMEIITFITQGSIAHQDSAGHQQRLPVGEFQLMSAGKGIYHSEFNASHEEELKLLQIWIEPNVLGGKPRYQQRDFGQREGLTTIATPDGGNGALQIKQDATLHQLILPARRELTMPIAHGRRTYIQLVHGQLTVNDVTLCPGDGAKIVEENSLDLINQSDQTVTALVFDLP